MRAFLAFVEKKTARRWCWRKGYERGECVMSLRHGAGVEGEYVVEMVFWRRKANLGKSTYPVVIPNRIIAVSKTKKIT